MCVLLINYKLYPKSVLRTLKYWNEGLLAVIYFCCAYRWCQQLKVSARK
jgi:hypothetical protein